MPYPSPYEIREMRRARAEATGCAAIAVIVILTIGALLACCV